MPPPSRMTRRFLLGLCAAVIGSFALASPAAADQPVTVFAAASLKNALDAATDAWSEASGHAVRITYAGSSALARQIEHGAPADLFLSANVKWMDYLEKDGVIEPDSRRDLLGNSLVLVAPKASTQSLAISPELDLAAALEGASEGALVLLDEIGVGTDPGEAAALAQAFLELLLTRELRILATTHLAPLKRFAQEAERCLNAAVSLDEDGRPTFELLLGRSGRSYALEVVRQAGLPASLIARAAELHRGEA